LACQTEYTAKQYDGFRELAKKMCTYLPKENTWDACESATKKIRELFTYDVDVVLFDGRPQLSFGSKTREQILLDLAD